MTDDTYELLARLARLERKNRRLERGLIASVGGLGLLGLMGFAAPVCKTVWAERFVLQDASDRTRVTLNAYGTDQPGVTFHDSRGKALASFAIRDDGGIAVEVFEEGRAKPAKFTVTEDGALALAAASPKADGVPASKATSRKHDNVD